MAKGAVVDRPIEGTAVQRGPEVRDHGTWLPEEKRYLLRLWLALHRSAADAVGRGAVPATRRA